MVPSIFEVTKKRVPEATESRDQCAAASYRVRLSDYYHQETKLEVNGGRRLHAPINFPEARLSFLISQKPTSGPE